MSKKGLFLALLFLSGSGIVITETSTGQEERATDVVQQGQDQRADGQWIPHHDHEGKAFQAPQEPDRKLALGTCPAGAQLVDVCIDSAMDIYSTGVWTPPSPHGAAGPKSLVATTKLAIECLGKDGTTVFGPTSLNAMFASLSPSTLFSPKVRYDVHQHRFVVVVLDRTVLTSGAVTDSNIMLAVSKNNDPKSVTTTDWYFRKIPSFHDGYYASGPFYAPGPGISMDEEAIYITADLVTNQGDYESLLWIIAKTDFYAGNTPVWAVHDYIAKTGFHGFYGPHMPAVVRSPSGIPSDVGTYLVGYSGLTDGTNEGVQVIQVKNPLTDATFLHHIVPMGNIDSSGNFEIPDAPQAGTSVLIDTHFPNALDAVWVNNALWVVFTIKKVTGQTAAYWVKLKADGVTWPPSPVDHGPIDGEAIGAGMYTFFPSMDVNSKGVAAFGFSASSTSSYVSAYATIRDDPVDALSTVRAPELVKAGLAPYNIFGGGGVNRWGLYTGTSMDPTDEDCFWVFNQYPGPNNFTTSYGRFGEWKTAWARLCYKTPAMGCLKASEPCVFNVTKNVCCNAQKLVCRNNTSSNEFTCQKCLGLRKPCTKALASACCSKKCGKVQGKKGTFCIKK